MPGVLHEQVERSAYYDDRNFRGKIPDLIAIDSLVHAFDKAAGHSTQASKTAFICTSAADRKHMRKLNLSGHKPNVPQHIEIVGCVITAARRRVCAVANCRIAKATSATVKILASPVSTARKIRALCAKIIPMATYGMRWAAPNLNMAKRLRKPYSACGARWANSDVSR